MFAAQEYCPYKKEQSNATCDSYASHLVPTPSSPVSYLHIPASSTTICMSSSYSSPSVCHTPTACEGTASAIMFIATGMVNRLDKKIGFGSFGGHLHHACLFFILIVD